eukprot:Skav200494  [mRNA]  locus=scaffold450:267983:268935:+ [translate_table: standard]
MCSAFGVLILDCETLILCGGSKGGANALAAAIQWSVSHAELVPEALEPQLVRWQSAGYPTATAEARGGLAVSRDAGGTLDAPLE